VWAEGCSGFIGSGSGDQRSDGLAHRHTHYIATDVEVKDSDGQVVVAAHGDGGGIHDAEVAAQDFGEADAFEAHGVRVLLRILVIHAVHAGGFGDDLGFDFETAQGGGGIGGEVRVGRAGREDDDAAFFQMA